MLVWGLSYFPSLLTWGRRFAPEQLALAGIVVWQLGTPTALVWFLLLVAALLRLLIIGEWLTARLRARSAAVAAITATNTGARV